LRAIRGFLMIRGCVAGYEHLPPVREAVPAGVGENHGLAGKRGFG